MTERLGRRPRRHPAVAADQVRRYRRQQSRARLSVARSSSSTRFGLAYLHIVEGDTGGERNPAGGFDLQKLRRAFNGLYMANNGYDLELALEARAKDLADLICFGRPFISNPDLVERLRTARRWQSPTTRRSTPARRTATPTIPPSTRGASIGSCRYCDSI